MLYVHSAQIILELIYYYSNQWRPFHCWGWCLIKSYLNITEGLISVHQASASCKIYVVKLLVTHGKLSRWSIYSTQKINIHTETHTHTHTLINRVWETGAPFVSSFLSSAALDSSPFSWCCYMYYLYACPSLDTDDSCFAILNWSNQRCVKQEWIFYALGVRTSKSLL